MTVARSTVLLLALLAAGCASPTAPETPPPPIAPATITDSFTGTLVSPSSNSHNFIVGVTGMIAVTLTAAGPAPGALVGIGIGIPSGFGCSLSLGTDSSKTVQASSVAQITGTAIPGTFCLSVYDPDPATIEENIEYTVIVAHS
jgi:hypothetical protein